MKTQKRQEKNYLEVLKVWRVWRKRVCKPKSWKKKALQAEWKQLDQMKCLENHKIYYIKLAFQLTNTIKFSLSNWNITSNVWMKLKSHSCVVVLPKTDNQLHISERYSEQQFWIATFCDSMLLFHIHFKNILQKSFYNSNNEVNSSVVLKYSSRRHSTHVRQVCSACQSSMILPILDLFLLSQPFGYGTGSGWCTTGFGGWRERIEAGGIRKLQVGFSAKK